MKLCSLTRLLTAILALSALAAAATLTGTVTNGTTGKRAAGDDVVLLQLAQGMTEQARTKTDAQGRFKLDIPDSDAPHLVRVNHQGASYFPKGGPVMPGASTVEIQVYDVAKKVDGISLTVDMMRFQSEGGTLQATELWAVNNASTPPRTQMSDRAFELQLPDGAQVDSSMAAAPGGQGVNSAPVPTGEKNHYAFIFPLRPGETRFQVSYHLPYSGQATIRPAVSYPARHIVVMLPKTMQFGPTGSANFQPMGEEQGAALQVATDVKPGQDLGFKLSGTGTIQEAQQTADAGPGAEAQGGAAIGRGRPGGGLGLPEETPDPLHRYRWYILGGLAVALAVGAFYVATRPGGVAGEAPAPRAPQVAEPGKTPRVRPVGSAGARASGNGRSERLLEALKEELFQLELDRHQGRISQKEYETSKAALDHTIARAAARSSTSS